MKVSTLTHTKAGELRLGDQALAAPTCCLCAGGLEWIRFRGQSPPNPVRLSRRPVDRAGGCRRSIADPRLVLHFKPSWRSANGLAHMAPVRCVLPTNSARARKRRSERIGGRLPDLVGREHQLSLLERALSMADRGR